MLWLIWPINSVKSFIQYNHMATATSELNFLGISYDCVDIWNLLDDTLPQKSHYLISSYTFANLDIK